MKLPYEFRNNLVFNDFQERSSHTLNSENTVLIGKTLIASWDNYPVRVVMDVDNEWNILDVYLMDKEAMLQYPPGKNYANVFKMLTDILKTNKLKKTPLGEEIF